MKECWSILCRKPREVFIQEIIFSLLIVHQIPFKRKESGQTRDVTYMGFRKLQIVNGGGRVGMVRAKAEEILGGVQILFSNCLVLGSEPRVWAKQVSAMPKFFFHKGDQKCPLNKHHFSLYCMTLVPVYEFPRRESHLVKRVDITQYHIAFF